MDARETHRWRVVRVVGANGAREWICSGPRLWDTFSRSGTSDEQDLQVQRGIRNGAKELRGLAQPCPQMVPQGEIDRIEQKWKTTRWLWSQPKEGARRHRYMDTGDSQLKWRVISEGEAKK